MAFAAQTGQVPRIAWVIFIAAVVWAVIYDTIYAMVDREDDLKIGVNSSADPVRRHGPAADRRHAGADARTRWCLVGRTLHFGAGTTPGSCAAAASFLYQQWLIRNRDPAACLRGFLNNNYIGVAIFAGILLQYLYARGG